MVGARWLGVAAIAASSGCPVDATTTGGEPDTESASAEADEAPDPSTTEDDGPMLSDEGDTETEGGEPPTCPPSHACIAPTPDGWLGPVALVDEGGDACPDEYSQLEFEAFTEIVAAPALCTCECDTSMLCGALVGSDLESACTFPTGILDTATFTEPDVCTPIPAIDGAGLHLAFEPDAMGSCVPTGTAALPEPAPSDRLIVCAAPLVEPGCPGDERCVPVLAEDTLHAPCVVRTGEHACPDAYPVLHGAFTSVSDDRECSPCACSPTDGPAACDAMLRLSSTDDCSDQVVPDADVGAFTCVETAELVLTHLRFSAIDAYVGGCEPSGGVPTGAAEPAEPVTICCAR